MVDEEERLTVLLCNRGDGAGRRMSRSRSQGPFSVGADEDHCVLCGGVQVINHERIKKRFHHLMTIARCAWEDIFMNIPVGSRLKDTHREIEFLKLSSHRWCE